MVSGLGRGTDILQIEPAQFRVLRNNTGPEALVSHTHKQEGIRIKRALNAIFVVHMVV